MDKIFPYDLGKSQDIRIMVVFGVHDFLKVGLITGFCVARSIYWQSNFKSNFKVNTNLKKFVSHLQTLLRSCFLLCFRHELLMSVAIFFFKIPVSDSRSTYCNKSWNEFFARTGIRANELWGPDLVRETLL